jgi:hypothetical protein
MLAAMTVSGHRVAGLALVAPATAAAAHRRIDMDAVQRAAADLLRALLDCIEAKVARTVLAR